MVRVRVGNNIGHSIGLMIRAMVSIRQWIEVRVGVRVSIGQWIRVSVSHTYLPCLEHTSLNAEQTQRIESIQRRALIIIAGYDDFKSYTTANNICTLHDRRESLCEMFFLNLF